MNCAVFQGWRFTGFAGVRNCLYVVRIVFFFRENLAPFYDSAWESRKWYFEFIVKSKIHVCSMKVNATFELYMAS